MNSIFPKNHGISKLVAWRSNETLCNTDPNPSFLEGPNDSLGWWNCDEFHFLATTTAIFLFLLLCFDVANLSKGRKEDTKQGEERSQGWEGFGYDLVISNMFYVHPENWESWTHVDEHIFQNNWVEIQPPTSQLRILWNNLRHSTRVIPTWSFGDLINAMILLD